MKTMKRIQNRTPGRLQIVAAVIALAMAVAFVAGCVDVPSAHTVSRDYDQHDIPVDPPPCVDGEPKYDDFAKGGQLFKMYCGSCHYARPLGDRPFAQTEVAFAHMRRHAYLTGKEYRQLIHFLRRWHDVGPATADELPSPERFSW